MLERNYLEYSKSKKAAKQRNSHVQVKTQQITISQVFKIIIRDKVQ